MSTHDQGTQLQAAAALPYPLYCPACPKKFTQGGTSARERIVQLYDHICSKHPTDQMLEVIRANRLDKVPGHEKTEKQYNDYVRAMSGYSQQGIKPDRVAHFKDEQLITRPARHLWIKESVFSVEMDWTAYEMWTEWLAQRQLSQRDELGQ
jgi:hypothetical protein